MKAKLIIPFLALLFSCSQGDQKLPDSWRIDTGNEAAEVIKQVFSVLSEGNGEKRMEMCENSPDFGFILNNRIFSFDELQNYVSEALNEAENETLETSFDKFILVSPDCFSYLWQGKIDIQMKNGQVMTFENYCSTWTFRKTEGEWKMISGHESYQELITNDSTVSVE